MKRKKNLLGKILGIVVLAIVLFYLILFLTR